jgi:tyrosyl-tRNA synthetase
MIKGGGVSVNKLKIDDETWAVKTTDLLNDRYLLVQKGKKNYYLITCK